MKTALDITRDFPGTSYYTQGSGNVYVCRVTLSDGDWVEGYGSTLASAEDAAWYGVKITLR